MKLIPVIDLMAGQVVRGIRGKRSAYRPIVSSLCASSRPTELAPALLDRAGADTLYIADLDALAGGPVQFEALLELLAALPDAAIWLDAGFRGAHDVAALRARLGEHGARVTPIIASESLPNADSARECLSANRVHCILSLDSLGSTRLDPSRCWDRPELWPERVILMTLERVGAYAGPDLDAIRRLRRRAPDIAVIGAGGVRNDDDLRQAAESGAHAWLVASALHDGRISRRAAP